MKMENGSKSGDGAAKEEQVTVSFCWAGSDLSKVLVLKGFELSLSLTKGLTRDFRGPFLGCKKSQGALTMAECRQPIATSFPDTCII